MDMSKFARQNVDKLKIDISEAVCPLYEKLVYRALEFDCDEIVLKGGRSSMKSTVMLTIAILLVIYTKRSAVLIVRHNNAVGKRLYDPIMKILNRTGLTSKFKGIRSRNEFELIGYKGVKIQCIGADNSDSIKSISNENPEPYCMIGFEELNNFRNYEDVLNIKATFIRGGGGKQLTVYAFNPKRVSDDWCNMEFDKPCGKSLGFKGNAHIEEFDQTLPLLIQGVVTPTTIKQKRIIFHSTIYDIIEHGWIDKLGYSSVGDAEKLKTKNESTYKWLWLGANMPADGIRIFNNIVEWDGNKDYCFDTLGLDEVFRGEDFGQGQHYSAYVEAMFDSEHNAIYVTGEYGEIGLSMKHFVEEVMKINKYNFSIKCDYATVTVREQCEKYGQNLENCFKLEREMRYRFFSDDIQTIYINPELTPNLYRELKAIEYKLNSKGDITSVPRKDMEDDFIDAFMYAFSDVLRNR